MKNETRKIRQFWYIGTAGFLFHSFDTDNEFDLG